MDGESGSPIAGEARLWLCQLAESDSAGRDEVRRLVQLFINDARATVTSLHDAATDAGLDLVGVLAHNLRGSSATFGATEVAEICQRIQGLVDGADVEGVRATVSSLDAAVSTTVAALVAEFLAPGEEVSRPNGG